MKVSVGKMFAVLCLAMVTAAGVPAPGRCEVTSERTPVVEHTVSKGDNLMLLAGYYYRDPRQWREIYSDNSSVLGDPNLLIPGTVLRVRDRRGGEWSISYEEFSHQARN